MPLGTLPLNPFARAANTNRILAETKAVSSSRIFLLNEGPFHAGTTEIGQLVSSTMTRLTYGTDYEYGFIWGQASAKLGTRVYACIVLTETNRAKGGTLYVSYNAVGGSILSGLNFSGLSSKTAAQAVTTTLESQMAMPTFPTIANIWQDTTLTDIAVAKAALAALGVTMKLDNPDTAGNPYPQYVRAETAYDQIALLAAQQLQNVVTNTLQPTVDTALANHVAATNPHSQYAKTTDVTRLIAAAIGDYVTSTNVNNAYTVVIDPVPTSYVQGLAFAFKASATNNGNCTIDAGAGPVSLLNEKGAQLAPGDIEQGAIINAIYDTTAAAFLVNEIVKSQIKIYTATSTDQTSIGDTSATSLVAGTAGITTFGYNAGKLLTTGPHNTAIGTSALAADLIGGYNTAVGSNALAVNTNANNNAFGYYALNKNTSGQHNGAFGSAALLNNTTGNQNNAFGFEALYSTSTGSNNSAFGYGALRSNTTASNNSAFGYEALRTLTTGTQNTAIGYQALRQSSTSTGNTAIGFSAGYNLTGTGNNTAVGVNAMLGATTANYCCVLGFGAMQVTNADGIVAIGYQAAGTNYVSGYTVAVGYQALYSNNGGGASVAVGGYAFYSNQTANGTAIGYQALKATTTGNNNTAVGENAGLTNTTGYNNVMVGSSALAANTTGYANTAVGFGAGSATNFNNTTCLGANTAVTASNQVQLGDSSTTTYVYGTVQNRSDENDKADIRDTVLGLDFIKALRPIDYRWDMREDYKTPQPEVPQYKNAPEPVKPEEPEAPELVEIAEVVEPVAPIAPVKPEEPAKPDLFDLSQIEQTDDIKGRIALLISVYEQAKAVFDKEMVDYEEQMVKYNQELEKYNADTQVYGEYINNVNMQQALVATYQNSLSTYEAQMREYDQAYEAYLQSEADDEMLKNEYDKAFDQWVEDNKYSNIKRDGSKKRSRYHHGFGARGLKETLDKLGIDFGGFQDHSRGDGQDVKSIGYDEFIAPLVKSVQQLDEMNSKLSEGLSKAMDRIAQLEKLLAAK